MNAIPLQTRHSIHSNDESPLSCNTGHSPTFFRTLVTDFGTLAAMLCLMFAAFVSALITNLCADPAKFLCPFTTDAHQLCCSIADGCTFHIQLNASSHHFYIFFLCARRCTMIANGSATKTGFNAISVCVISFHKLIFNICCKSKAI